MILVVVEYDKVILRSCLSFLLLLLLLLLLLFLMFLSMMNDRQSWN
jgi:cell division protein FtsW (lipid II flippase)